MRILDMSAGKRNIWWNRMHPDAVFVDIREAMYPTVVADTRALPFIGNCFDLVVFDPPHMAHGEGTTMAKYYGCYTGPQIREIVTRSSVEAYRCTRAEGFLAFKWNDHDVKLDRMLPLMEGWEPLFTHTVAQNHKRGSSTQWVLLAKRRPGYQPVGAIQRVLAMIQEKERV